MKQQKAAKSQYPSNSGSESKYYKNALASLSVSNVQKEVKSTSRILDRFKIKAC